MFYCLFQWSRPNLIVKTVVIMLVILILIIHHNNHNILTIIILMFLLLSSHRPTLWKKSKYMKPMIQSQSVVSLLDTEIRCDFSCLSQFVILKGFLNLLPNLRNLRRPCYVGLQTLCLISRSQFIGFHSRTFSKCLSCQT